MKSNPNRLWLVAILLGWGFDFLFWKHAPGINFAIYVVLCLGGGFFLLTREKYPPARNTFLLLIPILFFAAITFLRAEPMTSFLAHALTLFLMALLALTYLGGRWPRYNLSDYIAGSFRLVGNMFALPLSHSVEVRRERLERGDRPRRSFWPIFRGLLIALPVVAIFASLLASADAVFADRLEQFIEIFRLEKLPEYIFRGAYILFGAYLLVGVLLYAALHSRDEKLIGEDKPTVPPFLGFIETSIVLGSVLVLFAIFVAIQFQYFFGGQANIHIDGYTYSEYARRGFGELVAVAFFSLLMILGLGAVTRRESESQRRAFSGLSVGIVALVLVMLVSAYQRLVLYEAAYGFSGLRTYTHVFLIWLAALLVAVVVLEILRRERFFAFAALIASIGFAASLPLLNVDDFIVRQNVQRAVDGEELDVTYLQNLSADATPALAAAFRSPTLPDSVKEGVGAALACIARDRAREDADSSWQSFHVSRWNEAAILKSLEEDLARYQVGNADERGHTIITPGGEEYPCYGYWFD
ncbi:MAG: DUF4173 domain-containing protein [Chloroflexota bacterium]